MLQNLGKRTHNKNFKNRNKILPYSISPKTVLSQNSVSILKNKDCCQIQVINYLVPFKILK